MEQAPQDRRVEVVAVTWEQKYLDRAQRVLQSWGAGNTAEAEQEAEALRQAIADADWDTIDHHGGLDAIMDKIDQLKQKTHRPLPEPH